MRRSRREFLFDGAALCAAAFLPPPSGQPRLPGAHEIEIDGTDFSDLTFLVPLLKDVRIVQLGENGHGASEAMRVRARIAHFLIEQLGFEVVAFESSLFLTHLANQRLAEMEAQRALTSSLVGVWHTREVLPLFELMRARRAGSKRIELAGFDVQPIGGNRKQRPAFFGDLAKKIDPEYATTVAALDQEFLEAYARPSAQRREFLRANGERLASGYDRLAVFLEKHQPQLKDESNTALVARQEAKSAAAYVRFQSATDMTQYAEIRDEAMFANLKFLAEELYPGRKVIAWGHNYHLRHDNAAIPATKDIFPGVKARSMGTWTRAHFGRRVYTIGQYEQTGTAVDNSRKEYSIAPPAPGTLEARLEPPAGKALFADIKAASESTAGAWLKQPVGARFNGRHPETLEPADQYDAVLIVRSVKPPTFLY